MLHWMQRRKSWENVIGQRECELSVVNWGTSSTCLFRSLSASPHLGDKDVPFLSVSHVRLLWYASKAGLKVFPAHDISHALSASNIHYVQVPYFGVACSECHKWVNTQKSSVAPIVPLDSLVLSFSCQVLLSGYGLWQFKKFVMSKYLVADTRSPYWYSPGLLFSSFSQCFGKIIFSTKKLETGFRGFSLLDF